LDIGKSLQPLRTTLSEKEKMGEKASTSGGKRDMNYAKRIAHFIRSCRRLKKEKEVEDGRCFMITTFYDGGVGPETDQ